MKFNSLKCHECGSDNINAGNTDAVSSTLLTQHVWCGDCDAERTEEFSLVRAVARDELGNEVTIFDVDNPEETEGKDN